MVLTLDQNNKIWNAVLSQIITKITDRNVFDAFIADTKIYRIDGDVMVISTGSKLSCQFLKNKDHY